MTKMEVLSAIATLTNPLASGLGDLSSDGTIALNCGFATGKDNKMLLRVRYFENVMMNKNVRRAQLETVTRNCAEITEAFLKEVQTGFKEITGLTLKLTPYGSPNIQQEATWRPMETAMYHRPENTLVVCKYYMDFEIEVPKIDLV